MYVNTKLIAALSFFLLLCACVTNAEDKTTKAPAATSTTVTTPSASSTSSTTTTTTTTATTTTTPKPKIDILKNSICKECTCDAKTKILDCSGKLDGKWFSKEAWDVLQNGDIIFETIKFQHNNLTKLEIMPPYDVINLDLSNNQISAIPAETFANLTKLTRLDLSHNNLTSEILVPDVLKSQIYSTSSVNPIASLKELNLGYNLLHTLNADLFEHLPNLERLTLSHNPFEVLNTATETAIAGAAKIKYLDLSYIEIKKLPEALFHTQRVLETLDLSGNLFSETPDAVSLAKTLKSLSLDENPIKEFKVFPEMLELEELKISYMPDITIIQNGAFAELPKLKTLIAADNKKLSTIEEFAFAKQNATHNGYTYNPIKELILRNNNLTVVNQKWFESWVNITKIDLEYNPWDCDCDNEFLLTELILSINKTTPKLTENVECLTPEKWKSNKVLLIATEQRELPCREGSGIALACFLVAVLILLPLSIGGFVLYRRGCFGLRARFQRGDDRALYSRATFTDDFHI